MITFKNAMNSHCSWLFWVFPRNFSQPMKLLRNGSLDEVHAVHINPSHEGAITRQRPPGKYAENGLFMWIYTIQMIPKCIWSDVTAISLYPFMHMFGGSILIRVMNIQRLSQEIWRHVPLHPHDFGPCCRFTWQRESNLKKQSNNDKMWHINII